MINGALAIVGMFVALMFGGFAGMWAIWPTAYRHGYAEGESDRHRHRRGDAQETTLLRLPTAGRIPLDRLADPAPLPGEGPPWHLELAESQLEVWRFKGEQDPGWAAEAAEYERPHQPPIGSLDWTAQRLGEIQADEHVPGVDTPSDFTRRMALDMDMFIKKMVEQSNYDQHIIRAD